MTKTYYLSAATLDCTAESALPAQRAASAAPERAPTPRRVAPPAPRRSGPAKPRRAPASAAPK